MKQTFTLSNRVVTIAVAAVIGLLLGGLVLLNEHAMQENLQQTIVQEQDNSISAFNTLVAHTYSTLLMIATLYAEEEHVQSLFY